MGWSWRLPGTCARGGGSMGRIASWRFSSTDIVASILGWKFSRGEAREHQGYLQSSWDLPGHLELDLMGRLVDRLPGFDPAVPGYLSLDVRLGWRPTKNLEVEIVGQNLLDRHHPEFGTSSLLRSPTVEVERAVYGKVIWRF